MIQCQLNNETIKLADNTTLSDLIAQQQLPKNTYAIAVDEKIIPCSQYKDTIIQANNKIEIIKAMQGG
tara:strand:+ start:992 stop:1195 length:204 start_codon:yes stop_codon:yes gene_type:complete